MPSNHFPILFSAENFILINLIENAFNLIQLHECVSGVSILINQHLFLAHEKKIFENN